MATLLVPGERRRNGRVIARCVRCGHVRQVWNDDGTEESPDSTRTVHTNPTCKHCPAVTEATTT